MPASSMNVPLNNLKKSLFAGLFGSNIRSSERSVLPSTTRLKIVRVRVFRPQGSVMVCSIPPTPIPNCTATMPVPLRVKEFDRVPRPVENAAAGLQPGMLTLLIALPRTLRLGGAPSAVAVPVAVAQMTAALSLILSGENEKSNTEASPPRLLFTEANPCSSHTSFSVNEPLVGMIKRLEKSSMLLAIGINWFGYNHR